MRRDMTEILSQMDEAPGAEQISAWLESLSDREVISRIREIRMPQATLEIVLSNYAALEAMRDDARRFAGLDVALD